MKINLLLPTLLAVGALALPLHAQNDVPAPAVGNPAATPGPGAAPAANPAAEKSHFGGTLGTVDTAANTITVQNKRQGPRTFQVTDSTKILKADGSAATLADLKTGDRVHGAFKKSDDGKMEVLTLKVGPAVKK